VSRTVHRIDDKSTDRDWLRWNGESADLRSAMNRVAGALEHERSLAHAFEAERIVVTIGAVGDRADLVIAQ
jgi:hypothetical protein